MKKNIILFLVITASYFGIQYLMSIGLEENFNIVKNIIVSVFFSVFMLLLFNLNNKKKEKN